MITFVSVVLILGTLLLGLMALLNRPNDRRVQLFTAFSFVLAVYLTANMLVLTIADPEYNKLAAYLITPTSALMLYIFYVMTDSYLSKSKSLVRRGLLQFSTVYCAAILALSFTNYNITQVFDSEGFYEYQFGSLYSPYVAFLFLMTIAAVVNLTYARTRTTGIERYQVSYILFGHVLTLVPVLITGVVMPILGNYSLWNITHLLFVILNVFIGYAVTRYKLFDIRFVVARSATYFLTISSLAVVYVVLTTIYADTASLDSFQRSGVLAMSTVVVAVSIYPLVRLFNKLTNRLFYRGSYNTQDALRKLSTVLIAGGGYEKLYEGVQGLFSQTINPTKQNLLTTENDRVDIVGEKHPVNIDHLTFLSSHQSAKLQSLPADSPLRQQGYTGYVEIFSAKGREGVWLFGDKANGSVYTEQDSELLRLAAYSIGQSLRNAKNYQEISLFSKKLQKEVERATSKLRRTNLELTDANQAKADMISLASHQLRPNITAARGFVELLKRDDTLVAQKETKEPLV